MILENTPNILDTRLIVCYHNKMKIRLFSDTHREFGDNWIPVPLPDDKDTVLILAGDIAVLKQVPKFIDTIADQFLAVVYVLGNHDMWKGNIDTVYTRLQAKSPNAYLLQNSTVTIGDVEFVGTTLWTDMYGGDPFIVWQAPKVMVPDYKKIRHGATYSAITPTRLRHENKIASGFLRQTIDANKKQVVVTHHAPTMAANVGDSYAGKSSNAYYYNTTLDDIIPDAGYWFFGHTHHAVDIDCGGTRVKSNPKGYVMEPVKGYDPECVIDIL